MLAQRVAEHPARVALPGVARPRRRRVELRGDRAAARADRGRPPSRAAPAAVLVLSPNSLDAACADLACLVHGIPVTPLNPDTDLDGLGYVLESMRFNVAVVAGEEQRQRLERAGLDPRTRVFVLDPQSPLRGANDARLAEAVAQVPRRRCERALAAHARARARRAGHRHVHVRQHRPAEGRRAHRPRARHEALRARGGAARRRRRRDAAVLPAALPHVRPLLRDARDALLGRHVRVRRQPVVRDARRCAARACGRPASSASRGAGRSCASAASRAATPARPRPCARSWATACAGGSPPRATSTRRCSASSSATASSCAAASA